MKVGYASMNTDYGIRPDELAIALEDRGFDSLWVGEHSHIPVSRRTPYPAGGDLPKSYWHMMDPFVSLTMAAAATTDLKLATGVCLVLEHDLLALAKQVATLDLVSGGRVLFGVGVGWNEEELANHSDIPWNRRYAGLRERTSTLRALWTDDQASFAGEWTNFDAVWSYPKPVQAGGPPVLMGCQGKLGMAHVVDYADAWCPLDVGFRDVSVGLSRFRDRCEAAGRDPSSIEVSMYASGKPEQAKLENYAELGVDRVVLGAGGTESSSVLAYLDEVAPLVQALG